MTTNHLGWQVARYNYYSDGIYVDVHLMHAGWQIITVTGDGNTADLLPEVYPTAEAAMTAADKIIAHHASL